MATTPFQMMVATTLICASCLTSGLRGIAADKPLVGFFDYNSINIKSNARYDQKNKERNNDNPLFTWRSYSRGIGCIHIMGYPLDLLFRRVHNVKLQTK